MPTKNTRFFGMCISEEERAIIDELSDALERRRGDTVRFVLRSVHSQWKHCGRLESRHYRRVARMIKPLRRAPQADARGG